MKLDWIAAGSFVSFILAFIYIPASIMWKDPLPPASGAAVTMEQVNNYASSTIKTPKNCRKFTNGICLSNSVDF